jgi:Fic family protein
MREWARSASPAAPSVIADLAIAHAAFERVHPFPDGNGRTGLLVLNLQLMRSGYPPAFIHGRARHAYLRGLREADSGDHARLAGVIARSVLDNLTRFVPREVATTRELLPLSELATESVDIKVLQRAIRSGKLKAARGSGRGYLSSRAWVAEYLSIRRKRT